MKQAPTERPRLVYIFTVALSVGFVLDSLQPLQQEGFEVFVISSPGAELDEAARRGAKTFAVPMQRTPSPLADLKSTWSLYRLLRRIRPDLINVGTPKAALVGGLAAALAGVPWRIYTAHGLRLETMRGLARRILWCTEWIACRCAHRVLCVSASLRERMVELKLVTRDKAIVLGHGSLTGIDTHKYALTTAQPLHRATLRQQLGFHASDLVIGFVGRFVRDKGIVELYQAFTAVAEEFPAARLLLVGTFEDSDPVPASVRQAMEQDTRVIWTGWQEDVAPYYRAMDVFAFPSHREGLGEVLLEAQAAGLPIAACGATGVVDAVVRDTTALLTPVSDVAALSNSLAILLGSRETRERFGKAGEAWVREHYSRELVSQRLSMYYCELLEITSNTSQR